MAERALPEGLLNQWGIGGGLTLVQYPASPFCIGVSAVLDAAGIPYTAHDVELWDRRPVIALTQGAYYAVPVLVDAARAPAVVVYEARDDGQDIARYVDAQHRLGLFPADLAGLQELVVQYIEGQVEDVGFRANDAFFLPALPDVVERTMYIRHKERKFGKGCVEQWRTQIDELRRQMEDVLTPLDQMLARRTFLLGERPVYADFALYGVIGNYLYSGENELPRALENVRRWHAVLAAARLTPTAPAA